MLINNFLLLGAVLFCIGVYGVIARKNAVLVLMSIELILNSVNINLLAFDQLNGTNDGAVFALYIIAIAAAEVGVGLAMVLLICRQNFQPHDSIQWATNQGHGIVLAPAANIYHCTILALADRHNSIADFELAR